MEKDLEFKYGDQEQVIQYNSGDKMNFTFPQGAVFFVGSNEGMVLCNKINIFKEELGYQIHTKIELRNDEDIIGVFFVDVEKSIQIILSSDDTLFKAAFIYNAF
ncbi:hypothetical protein [uncultured Clostridium sp.]|uniref:hypothetical protein n=1 Tax=uncultured Clostridium sp. TaxID=59620 RepID=UPI0028E62505|nr:hypothetical protein [uncultured Clostridium sp.]